MLGAALQIIGGFSCIAVLSFIRRRPSGFWRLSELFLGVVYVLALGIALFYGCLVVNKLRPPPLKVTAGDDGSRFNGRRGGDPARESLTSPNPEDVAAQSAVMRRVRSEALRSCRCGGGSTRLCLSWLGARRR